ncbi:Qat anti-phage system ATPase QatA [Thalassospira sp. A3_1]|uniref:Qat anti-phage system ATPase QatA n=1 Tax=Thalassospira sp. A3_1 TaxID=2821088 RepID=UPI001ADAC91E|nr:Qat anti-phage system ATPase QatA [Thalassospira sp. A3_1]MBO9508777.1 NTPase KAP [Thalassospira sp. A3_1]
MIVADNETSVDLLYYEVYAQTVARLIKENDGKALTVGIHGDWGAGKSSVLMMVDKCFSGDDDVLCVRFNGWLFQGYEDAKAVLIETIVEELLKNRSSLDKVVDKAKDVLRRVNWMKLARQTGQLGFTLATGIPHPDTISGLLDSASSLIGKKVDSLKQNDLDAIAGQAQELIKAPQGKTAPEQMHAFREEFEALLDCAKIKKLIVLVDDLDRCLPATAIETLEAIRLFLFVPNSIFVIAADEGMIEYAVRQHFPDLPATSGPTTYARNYLEKLIQVPFRLPALGYSETRIYITLLIVMVRCGEQSELFADVSRIAKAALQKPWQASGLERKTIIDEIGKVPEPLEIALELAQTITPILTDGSRGNPRQVKRFINTMMLRLAIAEERGFGDNLKSAVLAKIMLAERFSPEIYDRIAQGVAHDGTFAELVQLEDAVRTTHSVKPAKAKKDGKSSTGNNAEDAPVFPEWPNIEWAKKWAKIDPAIGEYDLRPYVFVTKDRRSGFGAINTLGHLDTLKSRLLGTDLVVRQAANEISLLDAAEAEQLFDIVRGEISAAEDLNAKPRGASGLAALCQSHKFLQPTLVNFLKNLPVSKLGPWVVSGWNSSITDEEARSNFRLLVDSWAIQEDNKALKAAATSMKTLQANSKPRKGIS